MPQPAQVGFWPVVDAGVKQRETREQDDAGMRKICQGFTEKRGYTEKKTTF